MPPARTTIADIARLAGVSVGAVSYALNGRPGVSEQTRARILAVADEAGWRPSMAARSLNRARAQAVGWVISRPTPTLGVEPFFTQLIAGLERELSAADVALLLQVTQTHEDGMAATRRWWAERRIDGVILTDLWAQDARIAMVQQIGLPAVIVGRPFPHCEVPAIWHPESDGVDAIVDYLVALGHRRIGWVFGMPNLKHTQERKRVYAAARRRHDLGPAGPAIDTDYTRLDGERAARQLLTAADRPTALVFDNDVMAVAALSVVHELGLRVPDDVSLVSADDSELCVLVTPAVTAFSRDIAAFGSAAARLLLDRLDAGTDIESRRFPRGHLVPRASTAAPPAPSARLTRRPARRRPAPAEPTGAG